MATVPTILYAGGEAFFLDLLAELPQETCRLIFCDTFGDTLDRAGDAVAVVIESSVVGGAEELCRRLRSNPLTSDATLIIRAKDRDVSSRIADEVVHDPSVRALVRVVEERCPDLKVGSRAAPPKRGAGTPPSKRAWDDLPPALDESGDTLRFIRQYTDYTSSVLSGLQEQSQYAEEERIRIEGVAQLVTAGMDDVLAATQRAVNDALSAGDLERMRELSAARSVLFDRLQRLRSSLQTRDEDEVVAPDSSAKTAKAEGESTAGLEWTPTTTEKAPAKSELTRAAEAKDAERRRAKGGQKRADKDAKEDKPVFRAVTVHHETSRTPWLVAGALSVLVIGGLLIYMATSESPATAKPPEGNAPPVMKHVYIDQTPVGIVARPYATDPEGDRITYSIGWRVDDEAVEEARTARLRPAFYSPGSKIEAQVVPQDDYQAGEPMRSQPLIAKQLGDVPPAEADTAETAAGEEPEGDGVDDEASPDNAAKGAETDGNEDRVVDQADGPGGP